MHVRTIDEGAIDEQGGMNFAEYLAILSGDTSLMEKAKLEKKITALESLKKIHFKEISRNRLELEAAIIKKNSKVRLLEKFRDDEKEYNAVLQINKDGIKSNPLKLIGIPGSDSEDLGKHIIDLYKNWRPKSLSDTAQKIGSLYGFNLYIRWNYTTHYLAEKKGYDVENSFYAQRLAEGMKYTYNNGIPNLDNPKLAARIFLNAIDRVGALAKGCEQEIADLEKQIPELQKLTERSFSREHELLNMKSDLKVLEKKIMEKIGSNKPGPNVENTSQAETTAKVIKMNPEDQQQKMYAEMRKNVRMKFKR